MPIFLPEPAPLRPADGKGFNRLSFNAHMGAGGAQCALRPRSYATLLESYNTMRARWGGFGPCIGPALNCGQCPVPAALDSSPERISFNAPRVLVRIHSTVAEGDMFTAAPSHSLWVTDRPTDTDYRRNAQPWTWDRLRAVRGWQLGRRHRDEIGEGFWMHRTPWVAAPHVEVRTRSWQTHNRHAFLVTGTRAALLTCFDECRHPHGESLNVIGQHTPKDGRRRRRASLLAATACTDRTPAWPPSLPHLHPACRTRRTAAGDRTAGPAGVHVTAMDTRADP
ncbi:hypothetical protein [Streptomyces violascens]|uniref:Uncharacterized protein n=1 Tax=Streptomyces violascens TaxID=67381 RepID=A0ABQ3QV10_9ACTN|nr:hypothetical protein [Streptomyces violascens]GHI41087.1 hypothetical protein Sviol_54950 [Streptomyces violascens]